MMTPEQFTQLILAIAKVTQQIMLTGVGLALALCALWAAQTAIAALWESWQIITLDNT